MITRIYRNKRNHNKYIEVHEDGNRHYAVKQFMYWPTMNGDIKNFTGDGYLHRWKKTNLNELLEDYTLYGIIRTGVDVNE